MRSTRLGQSELLFVVLFIGMALVFSVAVLSYFSTTFIPQTEIKSIATYVGYERQNHVVRAIHVSGNGSLFLLRRLDDSTGPIFFIVTNDTHVLDCRNNVKVVREDRLINVEELMSVNAENVLVYENGIIYAYDVYAKAYEYPQLAKLNICLVEPSRDSGNSVIRIEGYGDTSKIYLHIVIIINNKPFIISTHSYGTR